MCTKNVPSLGAASRSVLSGQILLVIPKLTFLYTPRPRFGVPITLQRSQFLHKTITMIFQNFRISVDHEEFGCILVVGSAWRGGGAQYIAF